MAENRRLAGVCLACCLALTHPSVALASGLPERLQNCAGIADDGQRLACFDALTAEAAQAAAIPAAMTGTVTDASPADGAAREAAFGMEQRLLRQWQSEPGTVSEIRATIRRLGSGPNNWLVMELDNGQTWAQAEAPQYQILLGVGDEVTIRRGAMGSFLLSTPDHRSLRVRRKN